MTKAMEEARAMPERIWITMEDHPASWAGSFRRWHASDLDHGDEYPQYVRADAHSTALAARDAEIERLREALAFYAERQNYVSRTGYDSPISRDGFGGRARTAGCQHG